MRIHNVNIGRVDTHRILTATYVGLIWVSRRETRLTCSCGWVDKAHADMAESAARIHVEVAHGNDAHYTYIPSNLYPTASSR